MALATDKQILLYLGELFAGINVSDAGQAVKTLTIRIPGQHEPNLDKLDEWADWSILGTLNFPSRPNITKRTITLQLMLYTRHANIRTDGKFARHYELASIFSPYLNAVRYQVNNTCIVVKEARIDYLDLRALGDFAAPVKQRSPKMDTAQAVIIVEAEINENKGF